MGIQNVTKQILTPLATGLAQQDWTIWQVERYLQRWLPAPLGKLAPALARDLMQAFPACVAPDAAQIIQHLKGNPVTEDLRVYAERTGARAIPPTASPVFRPAPALEGCELPALSTPDDLADWLALTPEQLTRFSDCMGLSARTDGPFAPHYRHHFSPKPDGTWRLLEEPKPLLKRLQRRILRDMLNHVPAHPAAYGFCPGRNAAMAAARHAGEAVVVSFDLAAFFPSIAQHRVYAVFRRLGYPAAVAQHLTGLCTAITPLGVLNRSDLAAADHLTARHLPQGAPTSPALANLVAFALDTRLAGLARRIEATYTRYADDLTFSGDGHIAATLLRAVPQIVQDCGFALNPQKTRRQNKSVRQMVTGLVVNQHLNLPRPDYDLLKATIHHLGHPKDPRRSDAAFLIHLSGRIAWLEQINPVKGARLRDRLADALNAGG